MEDGIMQKDIKKMRRYYLHTSAFYLDAASIVPLDILYIFIKHEPAITHEPPDKVSPFLAFS